MSPGSEAPPLAPLAMIRALVARLEGVDLAVRGPIAEQQDTLDPIIAGLHAIADRMVGEQERQAQAEEHGAAILEVMVAAAAQDYRLRAPVSDDDTTLDAVATGLNMLLDELVASQESAARLQAEIIRTQEAIIQELSTPLIPLNDAVLVMPLIGAVDSRRALQILERLLEGVATYQAHTIIMDVTGMAILDTQVADTLLRAARAVALLGARLVLTGIRPEVAQLLVGLGADLQGIETRAGRHYLCHPDRPALKLGMRKRF
jgi:anti-anti-sigma regulatory factor